VDIGAQVAVCHFFRAGQKRGSIDYGSIVEEGNDSRENHESVMPRDLAVAKRNWRREKPGEVSAAQCRADEGQTRPSRGRLEEDTGTLAIHCASTMIPPKASYEVTRSGCSLLRSKAVGPAPGRPTLQAEALVEQVRRRNLDFCPSSHPVQRASLSTSREHRNKRGVQSQCAQPVF